VKTVSLDVHSEWSQLVVVDEHGEIILEMKVETKPEPLRQVIGGIPGRKRVLFEEGPMSVLIRDALDDLVDEIVSCDPARNALIARAEDKDDERDARRLVTLDRAGAIHPVYVPEEPYRTLRSLLNHDRYMTQTITSVKNRIKAMCRRQGVSTRGIGVYKPNGRKTVLGKMPNAAARWQLDSLYRQLDFLHKERTGVHRVLTKKSQKIAEIDRLQSIPGVGPIVAQTLVAWLVNPLRFKSRSALSSYAGLGLGQGITNWRPVGHARASKRGQRAVKRVLFLAATAAIRSSSNLSRRYRMRITSGWEHRKAIRDLARTILFIVRAVWITGKEYQDDYVNVPDTIGSTG